MNIAGHLVRNAKRAPDQAALGLGEAVAANWRDMARDVASVAAGLHIAGFRSGDRIAVVSGNLPEYALALYAIWHAGMVAVPINAKLHPRELSYCFEHSGARLIFCSSDISGAVGGVCGNVPTVEFGGTEWHRMRSSEPMPIVDVEHDDIAWLFYTSGTTGRPKGAMLTHRNLLAMAMSYFVDIDPPSPGGAIVHAAPMSHGSGLYSIPMLAIGNAQVVPESGQFDPAEIVALWRRWPSVTMFAAPTMIKRLVAHGGDPGLLRVIVYGGAPMYVADLKAAIDVYGYRFAQLYGQGESPMCITGMTRATVEAAHRSGDDAVLGSVGTPQSVVDVRLADDGEVLVRGDSVMKGYWGDPDATSRALAGGWLQTGDVGAFDERGYLTLRDRSKDVIISGGSNIYPREVEEAIQEHPAVAEVSVIGVPDRDWGERVVAFVVARDKDLDARRLDALCLERIARFKRPKEYRFIEALPKNAYGKILKTELRQRYAAEDGSGGKV
ncbi:MAG: AMP-binding protein [Alphaproteobacteria bacterium]|nr:AMP-binding protein [Alphaproteobacteria bacterium]